MTDLERMQFVDSYRVRPVHRTLFRRQWCQESCHVVILPARLLLTTLNYVRPSGAQACVLTLFCCRDLDFDSMTLKLESDLDILKIYLHINDEAATKEVARSKHLIVRAWIQKYDNGCQGLSSYTNDKYFLSFCAERHTDEQTPTVQYNTTTALRRAVK